MAESDVIDFNTIPARALNVSSRMLLSKLLNPKMEIPTTKHFCKDYRGLAELMGCDYWAIKNFEIGGDPTQKLIEHWESKPTSTIGSLLEMLEQMERFDIIDDIQPLIEQDAKSYMQKRKRSQDAPLQVAEISPGPKGFYENENLEILTLDDVVRRSRNGEDCELSYYDAYVCYAEEDSLFVSMLTEYLESPQIALKLCNKNRDVVAGLHIYDALVRLIEDRCSRMLIILSPEFLDSEECKFLTRYAAGLGVSQRNRKLIPLIYKSCTIPHLLKFVSKVDFTKADVYEWIWQKLVISIKGNIGRDIVCPSPNFCAPLYMAASRLYLEASANTHYPLMLPPPSQTSSYSQPSITFPSSSSMELPIPTTSSSQVRSVSPSRPKLLSRIIGKFNSSSSNNSSANTSSSGFQTQSEYHFVESDRQYQRRNHSGEEQPNNYRNASSVFHIQNNSQRILTSATNDNSSGNSSSGYRSQPSISSTASNRNVRLTPEDEMQFTLSSDINDEMI